MLLLFVLRHPLWDWTSQLQNSGLLFPPITKSLVWNKGNHSKIHKKITPHIAPAGRHSSCPKVPTLSVSAQGSSLTLQPIFYFKFVAEQAFPCQESSHSTDTCLGNTSDTLAPLNPGSLQKDTNVASLWYLHLSGITRKPVHPQNPHRNPRPGKQQHSQTEGHGAATQGDFTPMLLALGNVSRAVKESLKV